MQRASSSIERVRRTNVIWEALAWKGYEHVCIEEWTSEGGFTIDGLVVAVLEGTPSRTWYRIEVGQDWKFVGLRMFHTVEFSDRDDGPLDLAGPNMGLVRSPEGIWDHDPGTSTDDLSDCETIDIAVTPLTNTLAIRSLGLQEGETAEINVAYVTVPGFTASPARQRYMRLSPTQYRYESLASGFSADITIDEQGTVVDYPGLFKRVWPQ